MKLQRFAAIDIGSNAVRILFSNIIFEPNQITGHKAHIVRCPVRLGTDVFTTGKIGPELETQLMHSFLAFKHLMKVYNVLNYKACATSAMRSAENGKAIANRIFKETGIQIEIIDGAEEAAIIFHSQLTNIIDKDRNYLYMDVGGGSTELTFFEEGHLVASKSFAVGTIRMLNNVVEPDVLEDMNQWINDLGIPRQKVALIGSGGNINRVFKISQKKKKEALELDFLKDLREDLASLDIEERMLAYDFNPDRADVIIPALDLFIKVMTEARAKHIFVPKIGLADGMISIMIDEIVDK